MTKVEEVEYGRETAEKLLNFTYIFRRAGILILAFLVFASILIISNIIKITVYARRNEIEIMSLVGATSWFIKWPFIIEGFLQGFISSVLSTVITYNYYYFAIGKIHQTVPFLPLVTDQYRFVTHRYSHDTAGEFGGNFRKYVFSTEIFKCIKKD